MGVSIREKPKGSGTWWIFVRHDGTRKSRRVGTKKQADTVARVLRKKLIAGEFVKEKPKGPLFREQSKKWLDLIGLTRKASTHERYWQVTHDHILPRFGNKAVTDIKKAEIRDFFTDLAKKGRRYSQLDIIRVCLRGPFEQAFSDGIIETNPSDRVLRSLNLDRRQAHVEVMGAREQILFLDTAKTTEPTMHPFFLLLLRTGVRLGEGLAVQQKDIDQEKGILWVRKTYRRGIFTLPKNGRVRPVQLSTEAAGALRALLIQQGNDPDRFVFSLDPEGKIPWQQTYVREHFKEILRKAGLKEMRIHDLRHTCISTRISLGHPIELVSKEAGHSSVLITSQVYSHFIPDRSGSQIDDLDRYGRVEATAQDWHPIGTLWHPPAVSD